MGIDLDGKRTILGVGVALPEEQAKLTGAQPCPGVLRGDPTQAVDEGIPSQMELHSPEAISEGVAADFHSGGDATSASPTCMGGS
jgi:hypothetical protein